MSIIDQSYFINEIDVPISSNPVLAEPLTDAIIRYEDEILKWLLGYKEWKNFKAAYELSILDEDDENYQALPEKWDELLNGAEFTFTVSGNEITDKWVGLKNVEKQSIIAYYVYYKYRSNVATTFSGIGETKAKSENSEVVSPRAKMVNAWNMMVDLYGIGLSTTYANTGYSHVNEKPSAYNFLLANLSDYPDWVFKPLSHINIWGL